MRRTAATRAAGGIDTRNEQDAEGDDAARDDAARDAEPARARVVCAPAVRMTPMSPLITTTAATPPRAATATTFLRLSSYVGISEENRYTATILTALVLLWVLYGWKRRRDEDSQLRRNPTKQQGTAEEPPWPVVPGALPLVGNRVQGGFDNIVVQFETWAQRYGGPSGVYICYIGRQKLYVVCTHEKLRQVERYRPFVVRRRQNFSRALASVCATGVFTAEGTVWQHERKLVGPALNRKHVREYVTIATMVAQRLLTKWEQHRCDEDRTKTTQKTSTVTINADCLACAIDIIALVALAKDIDTLRHGPGHKIGDDIKFIFKKCMVRVFAPIPYWKIPLVGQYLDGTGWAINRAVTQMKAVIAEHQQVVSFHTKQQQQRQNSKTAPSTADLPPPYDVSTVDRMKSFLGKIMTASQHQEKNAHSSVRVPALTEPRIIGNLLTMFSAGSETTYNVLLVMLYEIAHDTTGLQDELYAELRPVFGPPPTATTGGDGGNTHPDNDKEHESPVTYEMLQTHVPRLRSLMYEILRMKGPTPVLGSESVISSTGQRVTLDGYKLPPQSQFIMLGRYASTIDTVHVPTGPFQQSPVHVFCPRRYLVVIEDDDDDDDDEDENDTSDDTNDKVGCDDDKSDGDTLNNAVKMTQHQPQRPKVGIERMDSSLTSISTASTSASTVTTESAAALTERTTTSEATTIPTETKQRKQKKKQRMGVRNRPTFKEGFRSFGSSVRVCPGRDLAEMEILIIIGYVLQKFEISLPHNHPPIRYVTRIAQTPDSDVDLVLRPR